MPYKSKAKRNANLRTRYQRHKAKAHTVYTGTTLTCTKCGEEKPDEAFYKAIMLPGRRGRNSHCKNCVKAKELKRRYGISIESLEAIYAKQAGQCKICGVHLPMGGKGLFVDHHHSTGKIRGFLCGPCNSGLGFFAEDMERLKAAIRYLEET